MANRRGVLARGLTGWAFAGPGTLLVVGLSIFPAVWAFLISRTRWNGIAPPRQLGWANYQVMADDPELWESVRHTFALTALFVPSSILIGLIVAIALSQDIRFIKFYRTCIFVPFVASAAATGILASYVFNPQFGSANELLRRVGFPAQQFLEDPQQVLVVICLIALWGQIGFTAVVYLAALQDAPKDLIEAATVDGACAVSEVHRWVWVTSTMVVNFWPSRSTTNCAGPVSARTAATISSGLCTSVSPTLTMMSPALMPAAAAGPSPSHLPICPLLTSGATQEVSLT